MIIFDDKNIPEIKIIQLFDSKDPRGEFVKIYNEEFYREKAIYFPIKEIYYSTSNKNVVRGMHFQIPPFDQEKIVHLISGKIIDVLLDLRKSSNTYGKYTTIELVGNDKKAIYMPKGFAHGFISLEDDTVMQYFAGSIYNKESDLGIRYDSFGYDWNGCRDLIVSQRDLEFAGMKEFVTPFV